MVELNAWAVPLSKQKNIYRNVYYLTDWPLQDFLKEEASLPFKQYLWRHHPLCNLICAILYAIAKEKMGENQSSRRIHPS